MLTNPEAQKFLAEQLKELIFIYEWTSSPLHEVENILWKKDNNLVKETEFDSIARLVEGKLTEEQQAKYVTELWSQHPHSSRNDLYSWSQSPLLSQKIWWWLTHADYVQRATALKEILK